METLDVAATVDGVSIRGQTMGLSSNALPQLNRQLQFVTYTNTQFHPRTADTGVDLGLGEGSFCGGSAVLPLMYQGVVVILLLIL